MKLLKFIIRLTSFAGVLMIAVSLWPQQSFAGLGQTGDSLEFNFKGQLQAMTPCSINNDTMISVPFGNVGISKVENGQYIQQIPYTLDCGNATPTNTVFMSFTTTSPVVTEPSGIQSSVPGLWVKVLKDNIAFELGKEFQINDPLSPPKLEVQLMKDPNITLIESDFSATGTLTVSYM